ncbi:triose-phosphate isomerase [Candidatus Dependentiae bacterium]
MNKNLLKTQNKNKSFYFIANWKMQLTLNEESNFVDLNLQNFKKLSSKKNIQIILCPSFLNIRSLSKLFKSTNIKIGAQNCSSHIKGAYTGQISAQSLSDTYCQYCIIGHSECRKEYKESNNEIFKKFESLISQNISPIICIGENLEENKSGRTLDILEKQLVEIFKYLLKRNENKVNKVKILIAYEPIWAIGTGITPTINSLNKTFAWLKQQTKNIPFINWKLLYGGSVNSKNVFDLKQINNLSGFLIGGSSLDFQEFEKVVIL